VDVVVKAWLGFAALGAGLIHLALVIGSPLPLALPLLAVGIAEFGWGVIAFTATRLPLARVVRVAVLVPILGWAALLLLGGSAGIPGVRVLPMLAASLLDLAVAIAITFVLRRRDAAPASPMRSGAYLLALAAGAVVVAALTTPALAATEVGGAGGGDGSGPGQSHDPAGHGH
jgi:hypothetical protein